MLKFDATEKNLVMTMTTMPTFNLLDKPYNMMN